MTHAPLLKMIVFAIVAISTLGLNQTGAEEVTKSKSAHVDVPETLEPVAEPAVKKQCNCSKCQAERETTGYVDCCPNTGCIDSYCGDVNCRFCRGIRGSRVHYSHYPGGHGMRTGTSLDVCRNRGNSLFGRLFNRCGGLLGVGGNGAGVGENGLAEGDRWWLPTGCGGKGCPPFGAYQMVYPLNPAHCDPRNSNVHAAPGYGVPMSVPLAPVVRHQYNYSWGVPASRLTPISNPVPPQPNYPGYYGHEGAYGYPGAYSGAGYPNGYCPSCQPGIPAGVHMNQMEEVVDEE